VKLNQKINIRTYLFVLKSSFERISRKQKGSSEIRFETISYSHLVSKFSFGEHPYQNLGRPKHPWALRNIFSKASLQKPLNLFWHVLTYRLKHMRRQKTPSNKKLAASVLKPILSREHVLSFSPKNILFPNKSTLKKCQPLHRPTKTLVERTTPEHFRKATRTYFCSKSDQGSSQ
jgi:hypothetical protein